MSDLTVWERATMYLEEDERLISIEAYRENRDMYDQVVGVVYLIRSRTHPNHIDWVWASRMTSKMAETEDILARLLMVRLRLPWDKLDGAHMVDWAEYHENRDTLELVDARIEACRKEDPTGIEYLDPIEWDTTKDEWENLGLKAYVKRRWKPEEEKRLLGINPDDISRILSK